MLWGRKWGKLKEQKGFWDPTKWGLEGASTLRVEVRSTGGRIVPCSHCRRVSKCAKFHTFTRSLAKHGEYSQGTNIMDYCDIYSPQSNIGQQTFPIPRQNRTSGKDPT
jgi:hypothetical protein